MTFTAVLTVAFFFTVKRRFHLRLSKIEEVLGLDCQEDEQKMQLEVHRLVDDFSATNRAKLTLIQMVRTGNHIARKRKKKDL